MALNLTPPDISELKPRITVFGVGGAGGNAVNNMITAGLQGVDFVVANTDAQALTMSKAQRIVQMGTQVTQGLGAGSQPDVGAAAAQEVIDEIRDHLSGANMVFVTAGMGGGTGTGAAPVIAKTARDMGILTVGVVTKPFHFEGQRRMRTAEAGIAELHKVVDTLLIIPNQNLFRVANEKTTFADAFAMADQVLYSGVACITDLMVKEGLINLDFADVRAVMKEMGKAMMGTGEASGEKRALTAAEAAIANPLIDDASMKGARGLLISITGGKDLTAVQRQTAQPEAALKELASKMRSTRTADRIERSPAPAPAVAHAAAVESAAHAAVAAALMGPTAIEDVSIRPMPIKPSLFEPASGEAVQAELPTPKTFIPPAPERTVARAPRMPRIDELPLPAQNEIKAQRGELSDDHPEKRRMSLMQRLASVGLGRRAEHTEPPLAPRTAQAMPQFERPLRPTARQPEGRPDGPVSEYARRSLPQGLDPHGRPAPVHNSAEEDQLDIPAFLRRQAN